MAPTWLSTALGAEDCPNPADAAPIGTVGGPDHFVWMAGEQPDEEGQLPGVGNEVSHVPQRLLRAIQRRTKHVSVFGLSGSTRLPAVVSS